jgi:protein TonB
VPSAPTPKAPPLDERPHVNEALPPLPPPPEPRVPLPDDRIPLDEREELDAHGDHPLPEEYEYSAETDRWELILKDPRRRVAPEPVAPSKPAPATQPAGPAAGALTAPRIAHQPPPQATPGATGRVVLRVQVKLNGGVGEVRVVTSSGSVALDESAIAAVREWVFVPASLNGIPVATWVEVPIRFAR